MKISGEGPLGCTMLMHEHGAGPDETLIYTWVMGLIDDMVLREGQSLDRKVWRETVELFDAVLQEQLSTRRPHGLPRQGRFEHACHV